jgi:hypothetical protein
MQKGDKSLTPAISFTALKAVIEAYPSPVEGMYALATDTNLIGSYSGGAWNWGGGSVGTGTAGQVVKWGPAGNTLVDAALIPPVTNILTLTNAAASTLAMNVTAGKTVTLTATDNSSIIWTGAGNLTIPTAGSVTAALLGTANVFTATQAIQNTVPALQFLDTTASARNAGIYLDGNTLSVTDGITTNGAGQVMAFQLASTPYNINFNGTFACITVPAGLPRIDVNPVNPSIVIKNTAGTSVVSIYGDANSDTFFNGGLINKFGFGISAPLAKMHIAGSTNVTSAIFETLRVEAFVYSGGVGGAAGFGPSITLFAETATDTTKQQQAQIAALWTDATNATRKAKLQLSAYDTAQRIGLEIGASGAAAMIGLYGVTPIIRPTTASAAATFSQLSGNAVNDASTFDGYTLLQVVKALRDMGVLT